MEEIWSQKKEIHKKGKDEHDQKHEKSGEYLWTDEETVNQSESTARN